MRFGHVAVGADTGSVVSGQATPPPAPCAAQAEATIAPDAPIRTNLGVVASIVASIVVGVFVSAGIYYSLKAHTVDEVRHLDPAAVRERGGPVYKEDLRATQTSIEAKVRDESEKTRAVVQNHVDRPIICEQARGGRLVCRVQP